MIDVQNEIFTGLAEHLRDKYSKIHITPEYSDKVSAFPNVLIEEKDNRDFIQSQTSYNLENHAVLMYEISIYSNLDKGRVAQCRAIAQDVDSFMKDLGFTRIMMQGISNLDDTKVYRMVARYKAVISENKTIFRDR